MRVAVHPCDNGGCGWYRLRWPAEVLAAEGHDVQVTNELNAYHDTVTGRMLTPVVDADVVVLQRPLVQAVVEAIPRLQSQGVAVVVEVDDDFHALPKGHGARRGTSVENDPTYNRMWLRKACERADLVTVTTPALAERYGAHGRVAVLPNLVPASYLSVPTHAPRVEAPTVGWTGSVVTHVGDLDVPTLASGTYTPTLTNVSNVSSSLSSTARWTRIGDQIHVSGRCSIDPSTTATLTEWGVSLPVASNFAANSEASGVAVGDLSDESPAHGYADYTNDRMHFIAYPVSTSQHTYSYEFTYTVI